MRLFNFGELFQIFFEDGIIINDIINNLYKNKQICKFGCLIIIQLLKFRNIRANLQQSNKNNRDQTVKAYWNDSSFLKVFTDRLVYMNGYLVKKRDIYD